MGKLLPCGSAAPSPLVAPKSDQGGSVVLLLWFLCLFVANLSVAALFRVGSVVGNPHSAIERAPVKNTVLASASQATWLPKSQIKNQKSKIPPPSALQDTNTGHFRRSLGTTCPLLRQPWSVLGSPFWMRQTATKLNVYGPFEGSTPQIANEKSNIKNPRVVCLSGHSTYSLKNFLTNIPPLACGGGGQKEPTYSLKNFLTNISFLPPLTLSSQGG